MSNRNLAARKVFARKPDTVTDSLDGTRAMPRPTLWRHCHDTPGQRKQTLRGNPRARDALNIPACPKVPVDDRIGFGQIARSHARAVPMNGLPGAQSHGPE